MSHHFSEYLALHTALLFQNLYAPYNCHALRRLDIQVNQIVIVYCILMLVYFLQTDTFLMVASFIFPRRHFYSHCCILYSRCLAFKRYLSSRGEETRISQEPTFRLCDSLQAHYNLLRNSYYAPMPLLYLLS